jgi:hypothetical protein
MKLYVSRVGIEAMEKRMLEDRYTSRKVHPLEGRYTPCKARWTDKECAGMVIGALYALNSSNEHIKDVLCNLTALMASGDTELINGMAERYLNGEDIL